MYSRLQVRVCEAFLEGQCRRFHCQDLHELPGMCRKNALFLNTPFDCNRGRWCDHSHEPMSEQEKELFMITERDKILHYVRKGWIQLSRPNAHWATPFIRKHFNIKNVIPRQQSQQGQKSKEAAGMLHAAQVGGAGGEGAPSDVCASEKGGAAAMQEGVGRVGVPGEKGGAAAMQEGVGRVGVPGEKGGAAAMQNHLHAEAVAIEELPEKASEEVLLVRDSERRRMSGASSFVTLSGLGFHSKGDDGRDEIDRPLDGMRKAEAEQFVADLPARIQRGAKSFLSKRDFKVAVGEAWGDLCDQIKKTTLQKLQMCTRKRRDGTILWSETCSAFQKYAGSLVEETSSARLRQRGG
uniref:C3H1-type domain-containing protein n=1 Tax=Chromera velia CCMP2878 TaxID=1169474 RepID=A0A0G4FJ86_9ALVE|eukprot:Cvel_17310.t1-p1 / transcript=Cvel_17310.t1 / gene=Cvel_17310 / organism=Chromera_velia_CCMP2878 / gene_product=hypothetical protein / transcript_product=hypothetical protein / location=Cvel_scaffold1374:38296-47725(-) / protein_length=351 / sequence_SO=supercontig / SO=protein_coding / is_pseudo=false